MIYLPSVVDAIQRGESIKIEKEGEEIDDNGKEWLKFLRVSYWTSEAGQEEKRCYYVPKDISCKEVSSSMKFVEGRTIDDNLYEKQLDEFFDGKL